LDITADRKKAQEGGKVVEEKKVTSIVLVQLPKKLSYFVGATSIDPAGGQICAIFDDGAFEMVPMTHPMISFSFNSDTEGPTLVTVSFKDQSLMFQAYIRKPVIRKFQILTPPQKRDYLVGERVDLTGLQLQAEYETGEKVPFKDIPETDYTVKQGDAVYPLNINGITVPIYIRVKDASLVSIRMGKLPNMTEYLERKDPFNVSGATVIKVYDSGVEQEVPLPYSTVRGFSNLVPGPLTLTVQIEGKVTTFEVTILEKKAVRLNVDVPPFRTSYTEGEAINMDGARVSVEYNNGETRFCDDWDYEPKVAKYGADDMVTLKVSDAVAQVPITVSPRQLLSISVCKLPDKTQYHERREKLDVTGAELELRYDYGEPDVMPIKADMVKGFDNRMAGECQVEVQYQGLATNFKVDILPQQLLGIMVTQMPEKVDYAPGEMFDKKGLIVSGFYDSGVLEPIRSYAIEPDRPLQESDVAILVTSMDKTAVIPIKVAMMFQTKPEQPQSWESDIPILDMSGGRGEEVSKKETEQTVNPTPVTAPETPPIPQEWQAAGPFPDPSTGFGIPPETVLDINPAKPAEEPPKKKSSFWGGRRLFYPNTSKYRGEEL